MRRLHGTVRYVALLHYSVIVNVASIAFSDIYGFQSINIQIKKKNRKKTPTMSNPLRQHCCLRRRTESLTYNTQGHRSNGNKTIQIFYVFLSFVVVGLVCLFALHCCCYIIYICTVCTVHGWWWRGDGVIIYGLGSLVVVMKWNSFSLRRLSSIS